MSPCLAAYRSPSISSSLGSTQEQLLRLALGSSSSGEGELKPTGECRGTELESSRSDIIIRHSNHSMFIK